MGDKVDPDLDIDADIGKRKYKKHPTRAKRRRKLRREGKLPPKQKTGPKPKPKFGKRYDPYKHLAESQPELYSPQAIEEAKKMKEQLPDIAPRVNTGVTSELIDSITDVLGKEIPEEHVLIRNDFHAFGREVMGRQDKSFHTAIRNMVMNEQYCMFLLPRGYAKSTIVSVETPLWMLGKNRDLRIVIATNALRLGVEWLREIENTMANNQKYKEVYGNLIPSNRDLTWTDTEKIVLGRNPKATHTSLYCVSVTGSTLGKRADVIICDDIMEPERGMPTEGELRSIKEWFWKVLFPILEPGGKILCVGTRWHQLDLYGELLSRGWSNIVQQALVVDPDTGEEVSSWPERYSTEELFKRRESMGSIMFNLQYQNNADISSKLQMEFLHMITEDNIPDDLVIYQGIDPCLAVGSNPDYFAIATIGVSEKTGKGYLLDIVRGRLGFHQQMEVIRKQASIWRPRKVGLETTAAQVFMKEDLKYSEFTAEIKEEVLDTRTASEKKRSRLRRRPLDLPLVAVPAKGSKINRILAMSAMFESGLVQVKAMKDGADLIPIGQLEPFVSEWLTFPNSRNDDCLDAVSIATRVAEFGLPAPISQMQDAPEDRPYYARRARISLFH